MENASGYIVAAVIGGIFNWIIKRADRTPDSKREIEIVTTQAQYWKTYSEIFADDPQAQQRAKSCLEALSRRVERVTNMGYPRTAADIISDSAAFTVPTWRFVLALYAPVPHILGLYWCVLMVASGIFMLAQTAYHLVNGPALWIWIFDSAATGFLFMRGIVAIADCRLIRRALQKSAENHSNPDAAV